MSIGMLRKCSICGREYSQWAPRQKTCTKKCSRERTRRYNQKANKAKALEKAKEKEEAAKVEMAKRRHAAVVKLSMKERFATSAEVVQEKCLDLKEEIELLFSEAQEFRSVTDHLIKVGEYKYGPKKQS